jgi:hypothetical protein
VRARVRVCVRACACAFVRASLVSERVWPGMSLKWILGFVHRQGAWDRRYRCAFAKGTNAEAIEGGDAAGAAHAINGAKASLPKHDNEHREKYEHILGCLRELEAGVMETAKSNQRYATELDSHQVLVSRMEPELEAATRRNADLQQQLAAAHQQIGHLQQESSRHNNARGNILAQLQDALLREADLRDSVQKVGEERDTFIKDLHDAATEREALEANMQRAQQRALLFEAQLNEARQCEALGRQRGQEYKIELESLQQKLGEVDIRYSSQLAQLADNLDRAQHAARYMHASVCRPDAGLTWCVLTWSCMIATLACVTCFMMLS